MVWLLVFGFFSTGEASAAPATAAPVPTKVPTRGKVVDIEGNAIEDASIKLFPVDSSRHSYLVSLEVEPVTQTDVRGEFVVRELAAGQRAYLRAEKRGYLPVALPDIEIGTDEIWLLRLPRAGSVQGTVTAGGKKVEQLPLVLLPEDFRDGFNDVRPSAKTGTDGAFRIEGVGPEIQRLRADKFPGFQAFISEPFKVAPGQKVEMNIELKKAAVVFGRLSGPGGDAVSGMGIRITSGDLLMPSVEIEKTDRFGSYRFDHVRPGPATISIETQGMKRWSFKVEIAAEGKNEHNLVIDELPFSVTGRVVGPDGEAIPGAELLLQTGIRATSSADGGVLIQGVERGAYWLEIEKEGYFFGGELLDLVEGPYSGFEWQLERAEGRVGGEIRGLDLAALSQTEVAAHPVYPRTGKPRSAKIEQGWYLIDGLAAGRWWLVASSANSGVEREIEIGGGDGEPMDIPFDFSEFGAPSIVRVVLGDGQPARDVSYRLTSKPKRPPLVSGIAAGGRLELRVTPGTYQLHLILNHRVKQVDIEIRPGSEQIIDLDSP